METVFNYTDLSAAYVSSDEPRWKNKLLKLAEEHPEEVTIIRRPEENDSCIYAKIPVKWIRIHPPRMLSDETKAASAERLRQYRESKNEEIS